VEAKYQVFVSSTFEDLQDERRAVMEEILNMGHIPAGMELFQASDDSQWDYVKKRIAASDYFLVIVAERYGSTDAAGISFTRREYEYALEHGVPVAAFLLSESARKKWARDRVEDSRVTHVQDFRSLVSQRLCKFWANVEDLRTATNNALRELSASHKRPGWIRADSVVFSNLIDTDPISKNASSTLIAAIDRDLSTAGYYRADQVLDFGIERSGEKINILLTFYATIVPTKKHGADVYKPRVTPPKGVKLLENRYYIDNVEVLESMTVTGAARDKLCVKYQLPERLRELEDRHSWPSPVLDYTIRFKKSDLFDFQVGRLVGRENPDPIASTELGENLVFKGKGAALTAQGVKWRLSRLSQ
jgi:hypothetical protein